MQRVASMLIEKDNRILLMTRSDTLLWCPPGGKVRRKETVIEGGIRELKEEVGICTNESSCLPLSFVELNRKLYFFYWVPIWNGVPYNREQDKCEGISWHDFIPKNVVPGLALARERLTIQLNEYRKRFRFMMRKEEDDIAEGWFSV